MLVCWQPETWPHFPSTYFFAEVGNYVYYECVCCRGRGRKEKKVIPRLGVKVAKEAVVMVPFFSLLPLLVLSLSLTYTHTCVQGGTETMNQIFN